MKIYHYTSIETLALILKNKTIRFNRLDHVDDLEEGQSECSGVQIGQYIFVSCWTENPEESIPLWRMYTDKGLGVRIGLDKEMFKLYTYNDGDIINGITIETDGCVKLPIPKEMLALPEMWVVPNLNDGNFYRKIQYVDTTVKEAVRNTVIKEQDKIRHLMLPQWGLYKNKRWAFQNESRFVLTVLPKPMDMSVVNPQYSSWLQFALEQGIKVPKNDIFLELNPDVLNDMEILLSPNMSEGNRIIVECLCHKYIGNIMPTASSLTDLLTLK